MEDELDDIAWELGIHPTTLIRERELVESMTVSMFCPIHKEWKHNIENPICVFCENEKLSAKYEELRRALELIQQKG